MLTKEVCERTKTVTSPSHQVLCAILVEEHEAKVSGRLQERNRQVSKVKDSGGGSKYDRSRRANGKH